MTANIHINYLEFKANDLGKIKAFYSSVFGWRFTDYGDSYVAFEDAGIEGGFEQTDAPIINGVLVVLKYQNLEEIQGNIEAAGGTISVPIFTFPGGKRFHFIDPSGNELAVWTEISM